MLSYSIKKSFAVGLLPGLRMMTTVALSEAKDWQPGKAVDRENMTEFNIKRYNPETGTGFVQSYWLDHSKCGPMVLDALFKIKNELDPTLAFRRSCREGICGSCAMQINGVNTLACLARITPKASTVIGPIVRFPVIKDLVVDMTEFYKQYKAIDPFLKRKTTRTVGAKEQFQSQEDRKKLDGLYECVLCACCTSICPSYWWSQGTYIGPAVLMQAYRWVVDSRDEYTEERLKDLAGPYAVKMCYQLGSCTASCPKGLDPRGALKDLKAQVAAYEQRVRSHSK